MQTMRYAPGSIVAVIATFFAALPLAAEVQVREVPAFPNRAQRVLATEAGAYLVDGNALWFVDTQGSARIVPLPIEGQLEDVEIEPSGGLVWGCTRTTAFATDASGAWASWGLPEDATRRSCQVAPSAGGRAWVVSGVVRDQTVALEVSSVGGGELVSNLEVVPGARFDLVTSDEAGGLWAITGFPAPGLAHFDGASWRVWSKERLAWAGTPFLDVFPLDGPVYANSLASDGVGGLVAAGETQFVFMRSTAPYPALERFGVVCPDCTVSSASLTVGGGRIWGIGRADHGSVLLSWDFAGNVVSREALPLPDWARDASTDAVIGADHHAVWIAIGGLLLRRDFDGWRGMASNYTVERLRSAHRRENNNIFSAFGYAAAPGMMVTIAPKFWGDELDVPYPRALGETAAGWVLGSFGHWSMVRSDPWGGHFRGFFNLGFGLLVNAGVATLATVTPEAFWAEEGQPFPIDGAYLGAVTGFAAGALVDLLLVELGAGSAWGRALVWSSFTAIGAPLGFHAVRSARSD